MGYVEDVLKTEFNEEFVQQLKPRFTYEEEFVQMMRNRMVMSYPKYGPVKENIQGHHTNTLKNIRKRLDLYEETGNTEWLIDVGNMCMIEWWYPQVGTHYVRTGQETVFAEMCMTRLDIIKLCLEDYERIKNSDTMVNICGLCMLEWKNPKHPNAHFRATDSHESPGLVGKPINQEKRKKEWWLR